MRTAGIALLLLLAGGSAVAKSPAGTYRLVGEHEVASGLLLKDDGRFEWFLAAGALDQHAQGRWSSDGKTIRLTTEPKPVAPVFSAGATSRTTEDPLRLKVIAPDGSGIAGVDLRIDFDSGAPLESYTQDYGWSLSPEEKRPPRSVRFSVPMHNIVSQAFAIDTSVANDLLFVLTPNDLGAVDFQDLLLDVGDGELTMHYGTSPLTYVAED